MKSIFEQYLERDEAVKVWADADGEPEKEKGLANLFVAPPQQDPYWLGNLREIESLLSEIGLKPNTIFGFGRGLENLKKIPRLNIQFLFHHGPVWKVLNILNAVLEFSFCSTLFCRLVLQKLQSSCVPFQSSQVLIKI